MIKKGAILIGLFCAITMCKAQTVYTMANQSVTDCTGTLTDSDDGQTAGNYDHNENFVFTICVPGAASIEMTLTNINTEKDADVLSFFDGNNTSATNLGDYDGNHTNVTITTTGNCLTIRFTSDASLSNVGWNATWESLITTVPMPNFSSIVNPSCNSLSIDVTLDQRFNCDSIDANNFKLFGPSAPGISTVTELDCDGNNTASQFRVNFNSGLIRSGTYRLPFESRFIDACDSVWILLDTLTFSVTDCPIEVTLALDNNPICRGTCSELSALVIGGDSTMYNYSWTPASLSGAGPHTVCPAITTEYILVVTDGTSVPGRDTITLNVVDPPIAQSDTTVCISSVPFSLSAAPLGGTWSGTGITNAGNGTFDPSVSGGGSHWVYYTISGCYDSVRVTVTNVWAGLPEAACPGAAAFQIWGFPGGGTWSGANVTAAGMFTPPIVPGSYQVTYTWNGCSANKTIEVDDIVITTKPDSMCRSEDSINLQATPFGGRWSGPGITNNILGTFKPGIAGAGHKNITYTVNGCTLDTWIYVKDVNARWNEVFCPEEGIVTMIQGLPAGGTWSGNGVVDALAGTWDVNFRAVHPTWGYNDTAWYTYQGCTAFKRVFIRPTVILNDSLNYCISEPEFQLNWGRTIRTPGGGIWTGPGIVGTDRFNASIAGHGLHVLYYDANTCRDSMKILIYPRSNIQNDTTFCITEPAFNMYDGEGGGTWSGRGVTNATLGTFRPSTAGVGVHSIYYTSTNGCLDSLFITVNPRPTVTLTGLDPFYCFKDTNIILNFTPAGGIFSGTILNGNDFNPALAGTGPVSITYTYGTPQCQRARTITTIVGDTLFANITQDKDSICPGEGINLSANGVRGANSYTYNWDMGRNTAKDIFELPTVDTRYILEVNDGCSNSAFDTVYVGIHPEVRATFQTSTIQCYGEKGWAKVTATPPSLNYLYQWNTNPQNDTDSIFETVGLRYRVNIVDSKTSCFWDGDVLIPGYSRISADFTTFPRSPVCINNLNPTVNIIDLSDGGLSGYWDFGDGNRIPYQPGANPRHDYVPDTNAFEIKLYVENEGGCSDSAFFPVCMIDTVLIYAPNAFTPTKKDGINDVFAPVVNGTTEYNLQIFNRWGQKVFETSDPAATWDGTVNGVLVPTNYFPYIIRYKGKQTTRKYQSGVVFILE